MRFCTLTVAASTSPSYQGPKPVVESAGDRRVEGQRAPGEARLEREVGDARPQDVLDVAVVQVEGEQPITAELVLDAEVVGLGVRRLEAGVEGHRERRGRHAGVRERAERSPEPCEARQQRNGRGHSRQVLVGGEAGELLHVVDGDHGLRRDRRSPVGDQVREMVPAVEREVGVERAERAGSLDLCRGQDGVDAQAEEHRNAGGHVLEELGIGERLDDAQVGAAEGGHVAHRAEAEAVVVDPGAGADHRLGSRRPGDAQARAEVVVVLELRVVVPAQPHVHHQLVGQPPVVLEIDRGVVVAQADLGGLVGETAGRDQGEEAGVDGAEAVEVLFGGEQLVAHHPELVAVDLGAQELDAALDVVLAQRTQPRWRRARRTPGRSPSRWCSSRSRPCRDRRRRRRSRWS